MEWSFAPPRALWRSGSEVGDHASNRSPLWIPSAGVPDDRRLRASLQARCSGSRLGTHSGPATEAASLATTRAGPQCVPERAEERDRGSGIGGLQVGDAVADQGAGARPRAGVLEDGEVGALDRRDDPGVEVDQMGVVAGRIERLVAARGDAVRIVAGRAGRAGGEMPAVAAARGRGAEGPGPEALVGEDAAALVAAVAEGVALVALAGAVDRLVALLQDRREVRAVRAARAALVVGMAGGAADRSEGVIAARAPTGCSARRRRAPSRPPDGTTDCRRRNRAACWCSRRRAARTRRRACCRRGS